MEFKQFSIDGIIYEERKGSIYKLNTKEETYILQVTFSSWETKNLRIAFPVFNPFLIKEPTIRTVFSNLVSMPHGSSRQLFVRNLPSLESGRVQLHQVLPQTRHCLFGRQAITDDQLSNDSFGPRQGPRVQLRDSAHLRVRLDPKTNERDPPRFADKQDNPFDKRSRVVDFQVLHVWFNTGLRCRYRPLFHAGLANSSPGVSSPHRTRIRRGGSENQRSV